MMKTLTPEEAFARSAPMVYTVVTCLDELGKPNALGVSWVTRTSRDPFLMLVSIDHARYSHGGISQNREFVINYPTKDQEKGALVCGMSSGRDIDKTVASGLSFVESEKVRCPTIDNSAVSFECRVVGELETGDHTVFVGEVIASKGHPDEQKHLFVTDNFTMITLGNEG
jgi:flavin reductase (DIM6/NTAB) family NADH-FMN oxidoreductase RutF